MHRRRLAVEHGRRRARARRPSRRAARARGQRLGQLGERAVEQRDEVDRVPPRVRLLHPLGDGELRRQRREHRLGALPAGDVERLERLVDEVERVAAVEVAVVGRGGEEHVGELVRRRAAADGGDERALRALGVAHLDEAAEPAREPRRAPALGPGSGSSGKRGGSTGRVGGDVGEPVVERRGAVAGSSRGTRFMKQVSVVRPRNQPPPRRATPKSRPARKTSTPARIGLERARSSPSRATSGMSRSSPSRSRLRWCATGSSRGRRSTSTSSPSSSTGKRRSVVGPLVERAAGRRGRSGVVPVAREDAVADRAAVEREAHVRAAVVDGVDLVAVGEQTDRVPVEVDDEPSRRAQLGERRGADERSGRRQSSASSFVAVTPTA